MLPGLIPLYSQVKAHLTFCLILLTCLIAQSADSQTVPKGIPEIPVLELNKSVEGKIVAAEKCHYQLTLTENQYASMIVEQRGIDVAIRILGADKKPIVQRDSILTPTGQEKIDFTALTPGVYILEIEAKPNSTAAGNFMVVLTELQTATDKEHSLQEARKFDDEALRLWGKGEYKDAMIKAQLSLKIREKELSENDLEMAESLARIALITMEDGDYEKAIALFQRALRIREQIFGTYHQDVAITLHNLALVYFRMGNFEESIRLYEKTIEIREKVLGTNSADLATSLNNLGVVYGNLADYAKAEQLIQRALEIKEKTLPPNSPSIATSLSTLAGILSSKGDDDKALELYKRALDIREKALGPDHPDVARSLDYIAMFYVNKGDYQQAEEKYLRALSILQKTFGSEHYRIARTLGNLAGLYSLQHDYAKAEPLFLQCITMMEKTLGKTHPDYATAIFNAAQFYTDKGDYSKAEPLYEQALSIAESLFGSQHPDVITYLNGLARNYQAKGDTPQAIKMWSQAHKLDEYNTQAILFTNSERQKLLYLNSLSGETNQFISAHLNFAPADPTALELALTTIFERKGRVSDAMALEFAALRNRFNADDQMLFDKLKNVTSQLSQKLLNGPQNVTLEEHQKQIQDLEEQKEKLEIEISLKSSEFHTKILPVTISSIKSAIPENVALIEFSIYRPFDPKAPSNDRAYSEPHYAVYIIHKQGDILWKDLGTVKTIDDSVELFRQALRNPKRKDVQQLARSVDEKMMQPIRQMIGASKQLFISPDGQLNLIPFEALVDENNHYLIENYSFTYLTSGRDLLRLQTVRESKSKPLIIANPTFGESDRAPKAKSELIINDNKQQQFTTTRNLSDNYFTPLSSTAIEGRQIQEIFPESELLTGAKATEAALKQTKAPEILHIATHGFFLQETAPSVKNVSQSETTNANGTTKIENPLLRSGLALAGANQHTTTGDDGILTALEASGLNLWGTKLVVLSACDTGIGEVRAGEGVYGLRRAFTLAGTETLVMSLWSVSDVVTRELMTNYYKNLKQGMGRAAALRQVQLEMLKRTDRRHPFYWASFIESGEWANLAGQR